MVKTLNSRVCDRGTQVGTLTPSLIVRMASESSLVQVSGS